MPDKIVIKIKAGKQFKETKSSEKCYRMAHDNKKVIAFFESEGFTATGLELIVGSETECIAEAKKFGLPLCEPVRME